MKVWKMSLALVLVVSLLSFSFGAEGQRRAVIIDLEGEVEVKVLEEKRKTTPAQIGMVLYEGDVLITKADSYAVLKLEGREMATVEISEGSQLMLLELAEDRKKQTQSTLLDLAIGKLLIKVEKLLTEESKFEVKTPTSIVGVRGTIFSVEVEAIE